MPAPSALGGPGPGGGEGDGAGARPPRPLALRAVPSSGSGAPAPRGCAATGGGGSSADRAGDSCWTKKLGDCQVADGVGSAGADRAAGRAGDGGQSATNCAATCGLGGVDRGERRWPEPSADCQARQERLLRDLEDVTDLKLPVSPHLPAEFRLQLQLLQCIAGQGRLLQRVLQQQMDTGAQLTALRHSIDVWLPAAGSTSPPSTSKEHALTQRVDLLRAELSEGQTQIRAQLELLSKAPTEEDSPPYRKVAACVAANVTTMPVVMGDTVFAPPSSLRSAAVGGEAPEPPEDLEVRLETERPDFPLAHNKDFEDIYEESSVDGCRQLVLSPCFNVLCGLVITANVVAIGVEQQLGIEWALAHVGGGPRPENVLLTRVGYFFVLFYALELLLRFWAFRPCGFFTCKDWKWNMFDLVLVILAGFEIIAEVPQVGASEPVVEAARGKNKVWFRVLRLLKMFKLLRAVRITRLFRELRMLVASIMGCMATLFWSMLLIALLMYTFSLCFLQAISIYLSETPAEAVSENTLANIGSHWNSVQQATLTLYMSITGGSEWEQLADPLRCTGISYYVLFLFFIALSGIAVLNIITGLFVDAAMKVANHDDYRVTEEIADRKEVQNLRDYFAANDFGNPGFIQRYFFDHTLGRKRREIMRFLRAVEIQAVDAREVFRMLEFEGHVDTEEFISGCLRFNSATKGIDVVFLMAETRRFAQQFASLMHYVEEQFHEVRCSLGALGVMVSGTDRLKDHLRGRDACLRSGNAGAHPGRGGRCQNGQS